MANRCRGADDGQILPLAIGFCAIGLSIIFVVIAISSVYLERKRLQSVADSAVLAAADSFVPELGPEPSIRLTDDSVRHGARRYLERTDAETRFEALRLVRPTGSTDGVSAEVSLRARARPAILSVFVPDGIQISVTSRARGSLRDG
ncbi:Tad domain-containing protein [Saxibacter everestensis]|uniref:Tad domain-containing protein n=1 Tax=Saxibacter everestensis TaxID=2909229 RepID=A0ABY8QRQ8_9MICO|nr:Tad domain-containing protein [Brevibacteriaceae bacterium ZFBP1038]